jgi:hypothetical protein
VCLVTARYAENIEDSVRFRGRALIFDILIRRIMKAKEWVEKFLGEGVSLDSLKTEYALETRDLADKRSKSSTDKTKAGAYDGAIREQRQKWGAIASKCSSLGLTASDFDVMLQKDLNDVKTFIDKAKENKQEKGPKVEIAEQTLTQPTVPSPADKKKVHGRTLV